MDIIKQTYLYSAFILALLLAACSSDSDVSTGEQGQEQGQLLHLMAGRQNYGDVEIGTRRAFSVAMGDGTALYDLLSTPGASIRVYITASGRLDFYGDFSYDPTENEWTKKVPFDNETYYIYGFMPSSLMNTATIAPYGGTNYANGAVLTIGNVPSQMTEDFSAIVGVKRANGKTGDIATAEMQRGQFSYTVNRTDADNYVYILLDHVYACLRFTIAVDDDYYQLRKIHLKEFSVTPSAARFTVRTTLLPDNVSPLAATFIKTADTAEGSGAQPLWEGSKDIPINKVPEAVGEEPTPLYGESDFRSLYIAPSADNVEFTIHCVYDVYDKDGKNLIRKDCTSSNKLSLSGVNLQPGDRYTVPLIIMPTYIYVLSDPDLDNPGIPDITL
ncbi:MAG: hypothetical protein IJ614_01995 [Prevotella sp.]|nr:hypothetical protein [Prevotella sp.]